MLKPGSARRVPLVLVPLVLAAALAGGSPLSAAPSPAVQAVSAAGSDFGFRLLHTLAAGKPAGNVFFSPFSISQALTLTLSGAGGQTQADMAKTLGLSALSPARVNAANAALLPALTSDPKVQITVANALWADKSSTFSPAFQADAERFYHAQATTLDLNSPTASATINGWVSTHTQGKITQIVTPGDVAGAPAVLTDAVYFHGLWQQPFDKADTEAKPFHLTGGGIKTVQMMTQTDEFAYSDTPEFQAASLPYGTGRVSLFVFLPKPGVSVDTLVQEATGPAARKWLGAMQATTLEIYLPRFKADDKAKLKAPLSALGMASAFVNGANFKPMGIGNVKIGQVLHRTTLDVDEQGTTATAATTILMAPGSSPPRTPLPPIPVMRVNRPFLVLIRDTHTGTLLFAGVIRDPQQ